MLCTVNCVKKPRKTMSSQKVQITSVQVLLHDMLHQRNISCLLILVRKHFEKTINKALSNEEKGAVVALKATYWLTKEAIPLSKYDSLLAFLRDVEAPNIKYFKHSDKLYDSYYTATELLDVISSDIDNSITDKLQSSPFVSILTDESTDRCIHKKMTMYARIIDPVSYVPSTLYLTDISVDNGTGRHLADKIIQEVGRRNIPTSKIMGLGTDGASAMTGQNKGLTGMLLRHNPHIKNVHCIAHRLALCTSQAATNIPALKEYQDIMRNLFNYFKGSASRTQSLTQIQLILQDPQLKIKEIYEVRWLSFYGALETIYRSYGSLLASKELQKDPKAVGLHKKMSNKQFLYITHMMMDGIPLVTILSQTFQQKELDLAFVEVNISVFPYDTRYTCNYCLMSETP